MNAMTNQLNPRNGKWKVYLSDFLRSFSALFRISSLRKGFEFFFNCSHNNSRSGPKKGLTKSPDDLLFTFPMLKGKYYLRGLQTLLLRQTYRDRFTGNSSRAGICASSVTNLPVSFTVIATEIPLHF